MKLDLSLENIYKTAGNFLSENNILLTSSPYPKMLPGKEHYYLLASIGSQLKNKKIIELGTHAGRSALCLNWCNNNIVYTYDIQDMRLPYIFDQKNIFFKKENLFDKTTREKNKDHLLSSDLIFIDVDPHEGILELEIYNWLKDHNYKGIILYDDIKLGSGHMGIKTGNSMRDTFWKNIEEKYKKDISHVGHWSGTGLISFNFDNIEITL